MKRTHSRSNAQRKNANGKRRKDENFLERKMMRVTIFAAFDFR